MKRGHFIGIDTHCEFCEIAVVNSAGQVVHRDRCDTSIAALRQIVEAVPRPRAGSLRKVRWPAGCGVSCTAPSSAWWLANHGGID